MTTLHETDFPVWADQQAALLRAGRLAEADIEHIAEDLEDMGNEVRNACRAFPRRIVEHLLKLQYSSQDQHKEHWRDEVINFRGDLDDRLTRSIENQLSAQLEQIYRKGRAFAVAALSPREPEFAGRLPETCPWTLDQLRDAAFWP